MAFFSQRSTSEKLVISLIFDASQAIEVISRSLDLTLVLFFLLLISFSVCPADFFGIIILLKMDSNLDFLFVCLAFIYIKYNIFITMGFFWSFGTCEAGTLADRPNAVSVLGYQIVKSSSNYLIFYGEQG